MAYTQAYTISDIIAMGVDIAGGIFNGIAGQASNLGGLIVLGVILSILAVVMLQVFGFINIFNFRK